MRTHLQILGWLFIALHALYLVAGVALLMVFCLGGAAVATQGHETMPFAAILGGFGLILGGIFALLGLTGTLAGWGILKAAPWARILGIILCILNLINFTTFSISTIIGIYGLIILFHPETAAIFEGREKPNWSEYPVSTGDRSPF